MQPGRGLDLPESGRAVENRQRWRQLVREWTGLDFPQSQRAEKNRQRWRQLVREWTGLDLPESQRAVENRQRWRQLVARSSVVPLCTTLRVKGQGSRDTQLEGSSQETTTNLVKGVEAESTSRKAADGVFYF